MRALFSLFFVFTLFTPFHYGIAEPLYTFPFSNKTLEQNRWGIGALPGFQLPQPQSGVFLAEDGTRDGYRLTLQSGDGILILTPDVLEVDDIPVVVTLEYTLHHGSADIAVIGLDSENGQPNGQLGYTRIHSQATDENNSVQRLHTLYKAPSGSLSGGAQITLSSNDESAEITLYSISVYPLNEDGAVQIPTHPAGTFAQDSDLIIRNINNDKGSVAFNPSTQNLRLNTAGNTEAANAGLQAVLDNVQTNELITASALVSKQDGTDGTTAVVIFQTGESQTGDNQTMWDSGVFIHNQNLSVNPQRIITGGSFEGEASNLIAVVQNGGGLQPSVVLADDLFINTFSTNVVSGLEDIETVNPEDALAAAMILPDVMYAGSEGSFSITAQDAKQGNPVSLPYLVTLNKDNETHVIGTGSTDNNGFRADRFTVPDVEAGQWTVKVSSGNQPLFQGQVQVQDGGVLFIETDKPVYKPGQQIQGRIVLLNNGLTPLQDDVTLSIKDAKGIKIHKEVLSTNEYGVAKFDLPLANELNFGTWKIEAQIEGQSTVEKDIEVDRLVLPAFDVDVVVEKDWFRVDEAIAGSVNSRFFFGKPVPGNVKIEALRFVGEWQTFATVDGRLDDGAFEFNLPAAGYVSGSPSAGGAGNVQLKITVTDDTGHEEKTDLLLRIVEAGLELSLIPESKVLKPGLSQELVIVASNPAGVPMDAEVDAQVFFIAESGDVLDEINSKVTVTNGVGVLTLDVPERTSMVTITVKTQFENREVSETLLLNSMYSPGAFFIHLRQLSDGVLKAGDTGSFQVVSTGGGSVFYDVYANGRTIFSSVSSNNQIEFTVTPEMAPSAKLVAYSIQDNNEVSVDVLPFAVEFANTNEVQAMFSAEEVLPGNPVQLTLNAQGQSMIGLAVVDESVFALAEGRLNLKNVFAELERIFQEPQIEVHEDPNQDPVPEPGPRPFPGGVETQQDIEYGSKGAKNILDDNHLLVLSTKSVNVPETEEIDPFEFGDRVRRQFRNGEVPFPLPWDVLFLDDVLEAAPPNAGGAADAEGGYQEPTRVRSFFPETWLWMPDLLTDANGNSVLDLTAPDNITTWKLHAFATSQNGIGITESQLRVFQDFFVEPDLPFAVTRGDRFPMRVRVFNYVDTEQEIRITLENAENLGLLDEAVQTLTVPAQGVSSVTFTLQPNQVGLLPVSLIAQSTQRADAIRKNIRVEPEGVKRELVHNGVLKDSTEVTVDFFTPPLIDPLRETPIPYIEEIVPDSERFFVAVTASLLGQTMQGLDNLLQMPFGCGEQNMIFLAPDIEIVRYLKSTGQSMPEVQAKAEFFITTGYQRELTFQRNDGSFSAFGQQDESGSLWLTAFVLNTFSSAREVRTIDETVLSSAANWILSHQKTDGSWDPVGFVIHNELQGGLNGNLALSAFVTLSLIEYGEAGETALNRALNYLATRMTDPEVDSYILSMITYTLTLADHPQADDALTLLMRNALVSGSGIYWEPHPIETTGYAVLSLLLNDRIEAQEAINWLTSQRNSLGGYGSTQDTVVALKALTAAAMQQSRDLDSSVDVVVNGETVHTMPFNREIFDVLQQLEIASADNITLRQTGSGRVLYQIVRAFNVPVVVEPVSSGLDLFVDYSADHVEVDDLVDVNVTITYTGMDDKTGMAVLDVSVPTGFAVEQDTLTKLKENNSIIKRIEQAGRKVIFYIDHLMKDEPVMFAFQIRALYPVRADGGANTAYLYYDAEVRTESANGDVVIE